MGTVIGRTGTTGAMEWALAGRPYPGETESGDEALVLERPADVLLAVADGLGHGPEAAAAARAACGAMEASVKQAPGADLKELFGASHRAQGHQRGVALSAALVDRSGGMAWAGVGNVEGVLIRAPFRSARAERLLMRGGVVGGAMPAIRPAHVSLSPGDTLVLATDGLGEDFPQSCDGRPPEALAKHLLARHARPEDDALVLVARYLGGRA